MASGIKITSNIDAVTNIVRMRARESYGDNVVDVEAAQLSNHRIAVKRFQERKNCNIGQCWLGVRRNDIKKYIR